ncbi:hypothetical protein LEP1GSC037_3705 [Leptospira interrogans str. 2006001854]|uniref:Uncharacterized protein n=1 Tax=Leptospira interrogans str. 2006001854 TaxID=1001590 RepID=M6GRC4_LEPIR|nr:hypothetical protein LEP1GSC037_3705 [Leptospira interrogans str. 2006001854]
MGKTKLIQSDLRKRRRLWNSISDFQLVGSDFFTRLLFLLDASDDAS